ncbi:MAG: MBL fold metallo-hydrolase [Methylocystaceae bacterium]
MKKEMKVIFWGVRGSRAVPGPDTVIFGGNTPCVEVQAGGKTIIFDSGTGICNLGNQLVKKGGVDVDIFITHTHWDHIQGFPFFTPAFIKGNSIRVYGQGKVERSFAELMRFQMEHPHFPVSIDDMGAEISFNDLDSYDQIDLGDGVMVSCAPNNHPNGCISYRVDYAGKSCCYVTDTEHYSIVDPHLKEFAQGTNMVIYDSNFTDEEYAGPAGYQTKVGWGHSTWREGIRLVRAAEADTLVLFHHATHRTDDEMLVIEQQAIEEYPHCVAAREGMEIII